MPEICLNGESDGVHRCRTAFGILILIGRRTVASLPPDAYIR
jgi:hypothetical protein